MKTTVLGYVVLLSVLRCSRADERYERPSGPSASVTSSADADGPTRPSLGADGGSDLASVDKIDRFLNERYADLIPRSAQQLEAVSAADRYVDKTSLVPRPRRYLVRKTSPGWDVTVMNLEDLRRAEMNHKGGVVVSVRDVQGTLEGVSLAVQE